MKYRTILIGFLLSFIFMGFFIKCAQTENNIPVTIEKISDRVIVLRLKHNPSGTNVTAVKSSIGIVVFDTEMSYQIAAQIRKAIEKNFGDQNIIYVVNTHHHWDHTNGNQTFRDAMIIGHENCTKGIQNFASGKNEFAKMYKEGWIDYLKIKLESSELEPEEAEQTRERIRYATMVYDELKEGFVPTLPNITFSDRLMLDIGDLTLNLMHLGMCHSDSDILIHIPEEKLLIVGDAFNGRSVKYIDENADIPRWLDVLNGLLKDENTIVYAVSGHGDMMTRQDLLNNRRYIQDLWEGMQEAITEGLSLEAMKGRFSLENHFPYVKHLRHTWDDGTNFHISNVETVWKMLHRDR
jgi:glyoxylase-like metal-dependent hydrolase (beta-lactamase superfamily II)